MTYNWALVSNTAYDPYAVPYVCWRKNFLGFCRADEISLLKNVCKQEDTYEVKGLSKSPVLFTIQDVKMSDSVVVKHYNRKEKKEKRYRSSLRVGLRSRPIK
jgi:hypothetical protein